MQNEVADYSSMTEGNDNETDSNKEKHNQTEIVDNFTQIEKKCKKPTFENSIDDNSMPDVNESMKQASDGQQQNSSIEADIFSLDSDPAKILHDINEQQTHTNNSSKNSETEIENEMFSNENKHNKCDLKNNEENIPNDFTTNSEISTEKQNTSDKLNASNHDRRQPNNNDNIDKSEENIKDGGRLENIEETVLFNSTDNQFASLNHNPENQKEKSVENDNNDSNNIQNYINNKDGINAMLFKNNILNTDENKILYNPVNEHTNVIGNPNNLTSDGESVKDGSEILDENQNSSSTIDKINKNFSPVISEAENKTITDKISEKNSTPYNNSIDSDKDIESNMISKTNKSKMLSPSIALIEHNENDNISTSSTAEHVSKNNKVDMNVEDFNSSKIMPNINIEKASDNDLNDLETKENPDDSIEQKLLVTENKIQMPEIKLNKTNAIDKNEQASTAVEADLGKNEMDNHNESVIIDDHELQQLDECVDKSKPEFENILLCNEMQNQSVDSRNNKEVDKEIDDKQKITKVSFNKNDNEHTDIEVSIDGEECNLKKTLNSPNGSETFDLGIDQFTKSPEIEIVENQNEKGTLDVDKNTISLPHEYVLKSIDELKPTDNNILFETENDGCSETGEGKHDNKSEKKQENINHNNDLNNEVTINPNTSDSLIKADDNSEKIREKRSVDTNTNETNQMPEPADMNAVDDTNSNSLSNGVTDSPQKDDKKDENYEIKQEEDTNQINKDALHGSVNEMVNNENSTNKTKDNSKSEINCDDEELSTISDAMNTGEVKQNQNQNQNDYMKEEKGMKINQNDTNDLENTNQFHENVKIETIDNVETDIVSDEIHELSVESTNKEGTSSEEKLEEPNPEHSECVGLDESISATLQINNKESQIENQDLAIEKETIEALNSENTRTDAIKNIKTDLKQDHSTVESIENEILNEIKSDVSAADGHPSTSTEASPIENCKSEESQNLSTDDSDNLANEKINSDYKSDDDENVEKAIQNHVLNGKLLVDNVTDEEISATTVTREAADDINMSDQNQKTIEISKVNSTKEATNHEQNSENMKNETTGKLKTKINSERIHNENHNENVSTFEIIPDENNPNLNQNIHLHDKKDTEVNEKISENLENKSYKHNTTDDRTEDDILNETILENIIDDENIKATVARTTNEDTNSKDSKTEPTSNLKTENSCEENNENHEENPVEATQNISLNMAISAENIVGEHITATSHEYDGKMQSNDNLMDENHDESIHTEQVNVAERNQCVSKDSDDADKIVPEDFSKENIDNLKGEINTNDENVLESSQSDILKKTTLTSDILNQTIVEKSVTDYEIRSDTEKIDQNPDIRRDSIADKPNSKKDSIGITDECKTIASDVNVKEFHDEKNIKSTEYNNDNVNNSTLHSIMADKDKSTLLQSLNEEDPNGKHIESKQILSQNIDMENDKKANTTQNDSKVAINEGIDIENTTFNENDNTNIEIKSHKTDDFYDKNTTENDVLLENALTASGTSMKGDKDVSSTEDQLEENEENHNQIESISDKNVDSNQDIHYKNENKLISDNLTEVKQINAMPLENESQKILTNQAVTLCRTESDKLDSDSVIYSPNGSQSKTNDSKDDTEKNAEEAQVDSNEEILTTEEKESFETTSTSENVSEQNVENLVKKSDDSISAKSNDVRCEIESNESHQLDDEIAVEPLTKLNNQADVKESIADVNVIGDQNPAILNKNSKSSFILPNTDKSQENISDSELANEQKREFNKMETNSINANMELSKTRSEIDNEALISDSNRKELPMTIDNNVALNALLLTPASNQTDNGNDKINTSNISASPNCVQIDESIESQSPAKDSTVPESNKENTWLQSKTKKLSINEELIELENVTPSIEHNQMGQQSEVNDEPEAFVSTSQKEQKQESDLKKSIDIPDLNVDKINSTSDTIEPVENVKTSTTSTDIMRNANNDLLPKELSEARHIENFELNKLSESNHSDSSNSNIKEEDVGEHSCTQKINKFNSLEMTYISHENPRIENSYDENTSPEGTKLEQAESKNEENCKDKEENITGT